MTCDKCYHNEVCETLYEMNGVPRIGATECAYFKDKERVVEVVPVENFMGNMHGDPVGEPGELCSAEKKLEEVKKALELHADCETDNCFECPYEEYLSRGDGNCVCHLVTDALALLREQRGEIERLNDLFIKSQIDAEQERFRCKNIFCCSPIWRGDVREKMEGEG